MVRVGQCTSKLTPYLAFFPIHALSIQMIWLCHRHAIFVRIKITAHGCLFLIPKLSLRVKITCLLLEIVRPSDGYNVIGATLS